MELAAPVPVELVLNVAGELGAFRHGAFDECVHVVDAQDKAHRTCRCRVGSQISVLRVLVGDVEGCVAKADLGVADLSVGHLDSPDRLLRAQGALVEVDGFPGVLDHQVGDHAVLRVARRVGFFGHGMLLSIVYVETRV